MKIIVNRVLVEQTSIKNDSVIIMTEKNKGADLVITFKILQLGNECPTGKGHVKVGDTPIFSEHVTFSGHKTIDITKAPNGEVMKLIAHTIVYYEDIIATEND
jgi:hypothetical protein